MKGTLARASNAPPEKSAALHASVLRLSTSRGHILRCSSTCIRILGCWLLIAIPQRYSLDQFVLVKRWVLTARELVRAILALLLLLFVTSRLSHSAAVRAFSVHCVSPEETLLLLAVLCHSAHTEVRSCAWQETRVKVCMSSSPSHLGRYSRFGFTDLARPDHFFRKLVASAALKLLL